MSNINDTILIFYVSIILDIEFNYSKINLDQRSLINFSMSQQDITKMSFSAN